MNIVVTGGAGFVGHRLVASLASRGRTVTVFDNLRRGSFERPGLWEARCIEGDIRDREACNHVFAGADAVVYLAAQANVLGTEVDPDYAFATNVDGTWNVLRAARAAGVGHLVFASSRGVYGDPAALPVPEAAAIAPRNLYGASKAADELLLRHGDPATPASIVRLSNVVGRGDSGRVVPLWLAVAKKNQTLDVFGGDQLLDPVPVDFVCAAPARVLARGPHPEPTNVGSGTATRVLDLAQHIIRLTGSSSQVRRLPAPSADVSRFQADVSQLRQRLGMEPPLRPIDSIEASW